MNNSEFSFFGHAPHGMKFSQGAGAGAVDWKSISNLKHCVVLLLIWVPFSQHFSRIRFAGSQSWQLCKVSWEFRRPCGDDMQLNRDFSSESQICKRG